ncbi:MAG: TadE/TadG family type IV pilus assembly protein [Candidatus Dormibacteria bacterium]
MSQSTQRGQAMVEMAIGVTIFLTAALGAVQLGISALSSEGAQSAALVGARTASGLPIPGDPMARLADGQAAAAEALQESVLDLTSLNTCGSPKATRDDCGLPVQCVTYSGSRPEAGTLQPCPGVDVGATPAPSLGPLPADLDGSQNPACKSKSCFGIARSMKPCSRVVPAGQLFVCLAYTSWPATAVDLWVRGTLRSVVPLFSSAGLNALPVSVQLRLQVEALAR